ncbi:MAG: class I SAM-dependent methyltransferase [Nanoarchaeota archaeon]|nr:class I SAM-dependent methyltransferase [Nanoarchaeota archaeon]
MIKEYKEQVIKSEHWLEKPSFIKSTLQIINKNFKKHEILTVLDTGCGQGRGTFKLSKLGLILEGLDSNPKFIKEAKKNYPKIRFSIGDIEDLPYPSESFNIVLCINTLFYTNVNKSLPEIERVLTKRGIAIITLDEKIINLDENEVIYLLNIDKTLKLLKKSTILSKKYKIEVDRHKHLYWEVVFRRN